jgi:hypothetical protein
MFDANCSENKKGITYDYYNESKNAIRRMQLQTILSQKELDLGAKSCH